MNAIELQEISYSYPNGFTALNDLSLEIKSGESLALIGQNGAGKTTSAKLMNNLLQPTKGDVLIFGENTKNFTTAQIAKKVGYVFQNPDDQIFQSEVQKEINYANLINKIPMEESQKWFELAIDLTGLKGELNSNPYNLPLSMRKFITIASVIAFNPNIIILDEPTAGQDVRGLKKLKDLIVELKKLGKTIITITHDMDFVMQNFERVIVMAKSKIIADGSVREIFWNDEVMAQAALKQPSICTIARMAGLHEEIISEDELLKTIYSRIHHV